MLPSDVPVYFVSASIRLMALLNLLSLTYRCAHWESRGRDSYARHLLFERLYDEVEGDIDDLAEKVIGLWGLEVPDSDIFIAEEICHNLGKMVASYAPDGSGSHLAKSITIEESVIQFLERFYDELRDKNALTKGMDDFLMALCSKHEHNLYLLQQAVR